ncbi:hypothetical protein EDD86DRAFT_13748 [Gorgonomyces haynaldii]|nr:hypothetical protein EDD86DRAFT_13748 [Gorgonomyces haynaldii]
MPWIEQSHEGRTFYFNTDTNERTWDRPLNMEQVVELKRIPDTMWAIVLTEHTHEFFYNFETKETVWDMPEDLVQVIGVLLQGEQEDSEMEESEMQESEIEEMEEIVEAEQPLGLGYGSDESEQEEVQDLSHLDFQPDHAVTESLPVQPVQPVEMLQPVEHIQPVVVTKEKPKRVEATPEEKQAYLNLLQEYQVSPFSSWSLEEPKLAQDPRFQVVSDPKQRKQLFEQYCKELGQQVLMEQEVKKQDPREAYLELVRLNVHVRTRFEDFSRKFKHDSRFVRFNQPQERSEIFKQHIMHLKKQAVTQSKDVYLGLLRDSKFLNSASKWKPNMIRLSQDPRFSALPNLEERERLFQEYIKTLD